MNKLNPVYIKETPQSWYEERYNNKDSRIEEEKVIKYDRNKRTDDLEKTRRTLK